MWLHAAVAGTRYAQLLARVVRQSANHRGTCCTTDVTITNGRHTDINDAFCGVNGQSSRHTITGNSFRKTGTGFIGGWGVDMNGGGTEGVVSNK